LASEFENVTFCPHRGQAYVANARCLSGVWHFGHGMGLEVTHAAKSSCERRSARGVVPVGFDPGAAGAVVASVLTSVRWEDCAAAHFAFEVSLPHCGQYIESPVPVDWSPMWQVGHWIVRPKLLAARGDEPHGAPE
jgi:hypothetical protein